MEYNKGEYQEFRCKRCHRLLCKHQVIHGTVEIKCYSCGEFNIHEENIVNNTAELIKFLQQIS